MNGWIYIEELGGKPARTSAFAALEQLRWGCTRMFRETDGRFSRDCAFHQDDRFAVVLTGVLLNLAELKAVHGDQPVFDLLCGLYRTNGETFARELRGPFSGVLYDKEKGVGITFPNQTGDMAAFFFRNDDFLVTSSDFAYIMDFMKENGIPRRMDPQAVRYMLTFGYLVGRTTFEEQVSRLLPGICLVHGPARMDEVPYYELQNEKKIRCTLQEAVELVDAGFRKAVRRCLDKDAEYGYARHLADLSAGFDSRMTTWVASEMSSGVTNISYSQGGSDERRFSGGVAAALHNDYIHMQLDNPSFLFDIDEIIRMNGGAGYYAGITGGRRLLDSLDFDRFGLEFTGQLGDVVVGTFCESPVLRPPSGSAKKYSSTLDLQFTCGAIGIACPNDELYSMMLRGFLGCLSSHMVRKNYTYAVSPFIDVDFMECCFSLPLEYRVRHRLYAEWVRTKYPGALKLPSSRAMNVASRGGKLLDLGRRAFRKAGRTFGSFFYAAGLRASPAGANSMNPFDYWYQTRPDVRGFLRDYYEKHMDGLPLDEDLKQLVRTMAESRKTIDRLMALTVLGVKKAFFD